MNWIKKHKIPLLIGVGLIVLYELYQYFVNNSSSGASSTAGYDPTTDPYYQALEQLAAQSPGALVGSGSGGGSALSAGGGSAGALTTPTLNTGGAGAAPTTNPTATPYDLASSPTAISETPGNNSPAGAGSYSPAPASTSAQINAAPGAGDLTAFQTQCAQQGGTIAADGSCYQGQFAGFADPHNPNYNPGFVASTIGDYCALQGSGDPAIATPDPACSSGTGFNIGVTAAPGGSTPGGSTPGGSTPAPSAPSVIQRIAQAIRRTPAGQTSPVGGSRANSSIVTNPPTPSCGAGFNWNGSQCVPQNATIPTTHPAAGGRR